MILQNGKGYHTFSSSMKKKLRIIQSKNKYGWFNPVFTSINTLGVRDQ